MLTNLQKRALTIVVLAPTILFLAIRSKVGGAALLFVATFIAGLEWTGVKRHLKVALLMPSSSSNSSAPTGTASGNGSATGAAVQDSEHLFDEVQLKEYPAPVPRASAYTIAKHLGWALLSVAVYYGERALVVTLMIFFIICVVVTLMANNRLEKRVERATEVLRKQLPVARASAAAAMNEQQLQAFADAQSFLAMELRMTAEMQPTEQFLDFSLDIFGIMWLTSLNVMLLLYDVPGVGKPWLLATLVGNFMNDIFALVVGRTLRRLRGHYCHVYDCTCLRKSPGGAAPAASTTTATRVKPPLAEASWWVRLLLRGPHQLYPAISPNKSVEGAVAGVLANAVTFDVVVFVYTAILARAAGHPQRLISPRLNSLPLWTLHGLVLGVLGVIGDLLESLLKRVARVKDAGSIIPGHGGILDRVDGMLLSCAFTYCVLSTLLSLSAP